MTGSDDAEVSVTTGQTSSDHANDGEPIPNNNPAESDQEEVETPNSDDCHDTVGEQRQTEVLERDKYQCRVCGRCGPQRGGLATLHIHHIERDPDDVDEDDPSNLTTLCRSCHNWIHLRSTPSESPVSLTEADLSVMLPQDIEILRYLADAGPARTGDIAAGLNVELSVSAVRERLWVLMGLDNMVDSRDRQVVDKDIETGEWGLVGQIETSARGHIPDDPQLLLQRIEDEQVRKALDRGVDRNAVMDVLDISRRTTFNKQKRASAYGLPLDAFRHGEEEALDRDTHERDASADETDDPTVGQQQLDAIVERFDNDELQPIETWGSTSGDGISIDDIEAATSDEQTETNLTEIREQLQTAFEALEEVDAAL